jgi:hypothetical protein
MGSLAPIYLQDLDSNVSATCRSAPWPLWPRCGYVAESREPSVHRLDLVGTGLVKSASSSRRSKGSCPNREGSSHGEQPIDRWGRLERP